MKEEMKNIGTEATLLVVGGLNITVKILDVRSAFGRTDYQVTPVAGSGVKWVSKDGMLFKS